MGPPRDGAASALSQLGRKADKYSSGTFRNGATDTARLAADRQLVAALRRDGFQGPGYELFERALVDYAYRVLMAWMRNGRIFRECALKGRPVPSAMLDIQGRRCWDPHDQEEIANLTIARALPIFHRDALLRGEWDPDHGATLMTYFVGCCVLHFPNQFATVMKGQITWDRMRSAEPVEDVVGRLPRAALAGSDPAQTVVRRDTLSRALQAMDEPLRAAALLILDGHGYAVAAAAIGISEAALSERLRRFRRRFDRDERRGQG